MHTSYYLCTVQCRLGVDVPLRQVLNQVFGHHHRLKTVSFTLLLPHSSAGCRNLSHNCTIAWLIGYLGSSHLELTCQCWGQWIVYSGAALHIAFRSPHPTTRHRIQHACIDVCTNVQCYYAYLNSKYGLTTFWKANMSLLSMWCGLWCKGYKFCRCLSKQCVSVYTCHTEVHFGW